ncbi:MAG: iron-containing alcohol dehydrogenase [Erysipelotrichaceae bacterium]|nr:iron-containing alcohol dehydrogenase [Erysipelotrichaceae bacterium]
MINFEYQNPTRIIFGKGSIKKLSQKVLKYGNHVLLIYGGKSTKESGLYDTISQQFEANNIQYVELSNIRESLLEYVYQGIDLCKENQVDVVIGIGGGCCIDIAKSIALGAANDVDIWDVLSRKVSWDGLDALPIGAIVTIAGSGSEMDGNSEIDNHGINGNIGSFVKTYPTFSILDPELTYSVPFSLTAYHGVTIIIQTLEQYFRDTNCTPIQDGFIETICKTVIESLKTLKDNPQDYDARSQLMWASALVTNRILGRGKQAPWVAGPLGHMIEKKTGLNYSKSIALTFPKYMMVCYKDNLSLFKQFAINVMNVDEDLSCEEIAYEGGKRLQDFFVSICIASNLKELGYTFTSYEEFQ